MFLFLSIYIYIYLYFYLYIFTFKFILLILIKTVNLQNCEARKSEKRIEEIENRKIMKKSVLQHSLKIKILSFKKVRTSHLCSFGILSI